MTFPTSDELYLDLSRRLPSWVFGGLTRSRVEYQSPLLGEGVFGDRIYLEPVLVEAVAKDPVYGPLTTLFGGYYAWLDLLLQQTRITTAAGEWLELHASERGTWRQPEEDDERLRARIRRVPEVCTDRALKLAAEEIVSGPVQAITLRQYELAWGRSYWNGIARWGGAQPGLKLEACSYWGRQFWGVSSWGDRIGQGPRQLASSWNVAVVIIEPQVKTVNTAWGRNFWGVSHWGGVRPDLAKYRALRELLNERRAAGVEVQIWIQETI